MTGDDACAFLRANPAAHEALAATIGLTGPVCSLEEAGDGIDWFIRSAELMRRLRISPDACWLVELAEVTDLDPTDIAAAILE